MHSDTFEQLLDRAASECGIDPGFWDIWGRYHHTPPEAKQAILRAMGIDADNAPALAASLGERTRREWERLLPPAIVAIQSERVDLPLHVPAEALGSSLAVTIRREDGVVSQYTLNLWELPQTESIEMDGRTWVSKLASIP